MEMTKLTDEMVAEIESLKDSEYVKLARKADYLKYRSKQALYALRYLEKRGRQLADQGMTMEKLKAMCEEIEVRV